MVFGWLIRFLVVMLLVRLVWRFVGGVIEGAARRQTQAAPVKGMPLVRDPVCDTYVDQARALTLRRKGETLYFCSEHCRTEFKQRS
jgi:YHS domain-containing protein